MSYGDEVCSYIRCRAHPPLSFFLLLDFLYSFLPFGRGAGQTKPPTLSLNIYDNIYTYARFLPCPAY